MDVIITPGPLSGQVTAPPSKSSAHRAAICGLLAAGESTVSPIAPTDDMKATIDAATALGASAEITGSTLCIRGAGHSTLPASADIDCNESGSTLRFFVPIAAAMGIPTLFRGQGALPTRPLTPLTDALTAHGVHCTGYNGTDGKILSIAGRLESGTYVLPGDISSQYITGLLFALPLLEGDSRITLTTPLQSKGYVDLTLQALSDSGIQVEVVEDGWLIPGGQHYRAGEFTVEGDYSGAAFWLCAGAMGQPVSVAGMRGNSLQGDRAVVELLRQFGAHVTETGSLQVSPANLRGISIDASQIPDLVPVLAVMAACCEGETVIRGAGRLRIKESDRLQTVTEGLTRLGADIREQPDGLVIQGKPWLTRGEVASYGDHRIAMAMSIAAIRCKGPVTVRGAHCVAKSYPDFYDHYKQLGGVIDVL